MKQLVIRADDLGYCEAVNYGIEKTVREGLIRSVGLMPNMDAAEHGVKLVQDCDIALGQHTNICAGHPLSDPACIPSLVDAETGDFKASRIYRTATEDIVVAEEAEVEIRAQLVRFRELVGRDPDYFECHAVLSPNFFKALKQVAEDEGLKFAAFGPADETFRIGSTDVVVCHMASMEPKYDAVANLKREALTLADGATGIYVCHPGYLDNYILTHSSLNINRTLEVDALTDPAVKAWFADQADISLIDYRDL